jgi:AcrR family transcriptional regulator
MGIDGASHGVTDCVDPARRWRSARGQDAAREILREAAHAMIRTGGLDGLNMRALARRVGLSAMAAYRYYPAKENLVEDVRVHIRRQFGLCLQQAAAASPHPADKVKGLCAAYLDYALRNEQDYRLMFGTVTSTPILADDPSGGALAWQVLLDALHSLDRDGAEMAILDQAHLVWATLHGLVMLHLSGRLLLGRSVEQLEQPLVRFLFNALRIA